MGIYSFLVKIGAPGGIARSIVKLWFKIKYMNPGISGEKIAEEIIQIRYSIKPPDKWEKDVIERSDGRINNIFSLCYMIAWAELCEKDFTKYALKSDYLSDKVINDYNMYCEVINEILEKKGFSLPDSYLPFNPFER